MACRVGVALFALLLFSLVIDIRGQNNATNDATPAKAAVSQTSTNSTSPEKTAQAGESRRESDAAPSPGATQTDGLGKFSNIVTRNWDAMVRSSYVFGGLCLLAIVYLGFRTWRLRRRRSGARRTGTRKYLPLHTGRQQNQQEMEPLGQADEDDDDNEDTLFESAQSGGQRAQQP